MLTISVWPRRLKEFLLTHPLYKSPWAVTKKALRRHGDRVQTVKGRPWLMMSGRFA